MANLTIRAEGRHKLRCLLGDAILACSKYDHSEYVVDFAEVLRELTHDEVIETRANATHRGDPTGHVEIDGPMIGDEISG